MFETLLTETNPFGLADSTTSTVFLVVVGLLAASSVGLLWAGARSVRRLRRAHYFQGNVVLRLVALSVHLLHVGVLASTLAWAYAVLLEPAAPLTVAVGVLTVYSAALLLGAWATLTFLLKRQPKLPEFRSGYIGRLTA